MANTPVSPKVVSSTITVAATTLVMYLLGLVHFIAVMPGGVKAALLVIVTTGIAGIAGWLARDPLRELGAQHPAAPQPAAKRKRTPAGQADAKYLLVCAVLALIAIVLVMVIVGALSIHIG